MDKTATFWLRGAAPLAWGRYYEQDEDAAADKGSREAPAAYEERSWPLKLWADTTGQPQVQPSRPKDGHAFIPGIAVVNCLQDSALHLKMRVRGAGLAKFGGIFRTGLELPNDAPLFVPPEDETSVPTRRIMRMDRETVKPMWLHVPSTGVRGAGKRVLKCFPKIEKWTAKMSVVVSDDLIDEDIFEEHLVYAGRKIGFGFWRRANGGHFGTFVVVGDITWT